MERTLVVSSNIHSVGYDIDNMVLEIEFKNGYIYQYYDVHESVFTELINSYSLGRFFNKNIQKIYQYERIK